jgi:hypothetical protein
MAREQSGEARQTQQAVQAMSTSISALLEQVRSLTSEVQGLREQGHSVRGGATIPAPAQNLMKGVPPSNGGGPAPSIPNEDVEETFFTALQNPDDQQLMRFVFTHWSNTPQYLPDPGRPAPLSQAVLLTMIHRVSLPAGVCASIRDYRLNPSFQLSKCLNGNQTASEPFQLSLSWILRAAKLIDRQVRLGLRGCLSPTTRLADWSEPTTGPNHSALPLTRFRRSRSTTAGSHPRVHHGAGRGRAARQGSEGGDSSSTVYPGLIETRGTWTWTTGNALIWR